MGNLRKLRKAIKNPGLTPAPGHGQGRVERIDLDRTELEAILERAKTTPMSEAECAKLHAAVETLVFLTQELEKKHVSIQRLKQLLFGATTETTRKVIERILDEAGKERTSGDEAAEGIEPEAREKAPGHGRHGAEEYAGAEMIRVPHESLKPGDLCPECKKGTVYQTAEPSRLVRIRGQAPLGATVYELQRLRCNLCGELFTAQTPEGVGPDKYDAESASMIALLKYGSGLPFNRLERLEGSLGIPLPAATQWEIIEPSADANEPVLDEMIRQAAQGQVLHHDDTTMKVLALSGPPDEPTDSDPGQPAERTGVFTSGVVSIVDGRRIALYFTGHQHAGENLVAVLKQRAADLGPPIQMCDALSRNMPEELKTVVANCLTHGRRRFVDVAGDFPDECLHVLELLKEVYRNDALAKSQGMSAQERLAFHKAQSGPKMDELKTWMAAKIADKKVEPNSGLGEAIAYMDKHWNELTLFLRQASAPLDNNICEQALKKAILHRKNAYFYKTANGARVGDLFMSLIQTCELNGVNPFDYLTALNRHAKELSACPAEWMPWNYQEAVKRQAAPGRSR
jgi:transposase